MLDQLGHDIFGHVARNGKADSHIAATARIDRGIDTDQLTAGIHEGPAGIAGIDRGVGLDEILVIVDTDIFAS